MHIIIGLWARILLNNQHKKLIHTYKMADVISDRSVLLSYISDLNRSPYKLLKDVLNYARQICVGLPSKEELEDYFKESKGTDKGLNGKVTEYGFFGQKPNSSSKPDLVRLGIDIKATAIKTNKNGSLGAKERLTLTNCGDTNSYDSFQNICDNECVTQCKYSEKMNFILFARYDDKIKNKSFDQLLHQTMFRIVYVNLEQLPPSMFNVIQQDYQDIRQRIVTHQVSQKGQKMLHIHKHGNKKSTTRALGFTQAFINQLLEIRCIKKV